MENFANLSQLNISDTTSSGRITSTVDAPEDGRELQLVLKL
ncbi:MAG TPA: hypothetical protein VGR96_09335 [Acidobacteriaceae bacterium]|nr:hypothetical protein [Acidobacteriaceae bacterium]